jgi:hypothetical protein
MTKLEELLRGMSDNERVSYLMYNSLLLPDWSKLLPLYEPSKHRILDDHVGRRDKTRSDGVIEKASRISIGLEKLLTSRMCEFMFAIPVKRIYHNTEDNETRQQIARAIEAIYKHARIDAVNKHRSENYFASCQSLTVWYAVKSPNTLYGFNSQYKLRCATYSPMDGVTLYPLFDEYGDMIAMSFKYDRKVRDIEETVLETYTDNYHFKWKQVNGVWKSVDDTTEIVLQKIPAIYAYRRQPIYYGLSGIREEIEYTLSRNSDVIAYNTAPVLKISGALKGKEDKGESRRVYRVEAGGDVSYVSWQQAIEALKYHVQTLTGLFWSQSQMPDISFEKMSSLGNIGYDARQTLLTDAHLKVGDEAGTWIELFERETNVIKAFLKQMNTAWASEIDNVEVEHVITPFIQQDEAAEIKKWQDACGGKAVMSQREAIVNLGFSNNPDRTLEQIREDEQAEPDDLMGLAQ